MHVAGCAVTAIKPPRSERTEQMLRDGPELAAVTATKCVVSTERVMATSQIPLKSLLVNVS